MSANYASTTDQTNGNLDWTILEVSLEMIDLGDLVEICNMTLIGIWRASTNGMSIQFVEAQGSLEG